MLPKRTVVTVIYTVFFSLHPSLLSLYPFIFWLCHFCDAGDLLCNSGRAGEKVSRRETPARCGKVDSPDQWPRVHNYTLLRGYFNVSINARGLMHKNQCQQWFYLHSFTLKALPFTGFFLWIMFSWCGTFKRTSGLPSLIKLLCKYLNKIFNCLNDLEF